MNTPFLPFALPDVGEAEINAVTEAMRSGWVTTGPKALAFERAFAEFVGMPHAVAVNSATAGLHLAVEAAGVGQGDLVVTSTNTFTATAEVVRYVGADLLLADIEPHSMNLDPDALADRIEHLHQTDPAKAARIKALIPVHVGGLPCDMGPLLALASRFDLTVIEDAAHALPCSYRGHPAGTLGQFGVYSFYATKTMTTGEGGMVVTRDEAAAGRMRIMRLHGIDRDVWGRYTSDRPQWYYEVVAPGFKYNMTDIAAAMGLAQLARCEAMRDRRQAIADAYRAAFAGDGRITLPLPANPGDLHAWQLFVIRLDAVDRDRFIEAMTALGVGTSVHFIPLHLHPYYRDRYHYAPEDFPVAQNSYQRSVSLPIYTRMTDADVERVIRAVQEALDRAGS